MNRLWLESLSFAQKQRLQFIEAMLIWDGSVQRSDVCKVFDVTPNHLTRDIKRYRTYLKEALEYDVESRAYRPGRKFSPLLASGSADEYLTLLQAYCTSQSASVIPAMGLVAHAETMPSPNGTIEPEVLRQVMHALRGSTGVRVSYQSFSAPEPSTRIIWPHTLVYTGERWHLRGFDAKRQGFRDFVLSRCSAATSCVEQCPVAPTEDRDWHESQTVEIVAAPHLSTGQRRMIAIEFGMVPDKEGIPVWSRDIRKCLIGYFLTRYRLERGGSLANKPSIGQHPYLALRDPGLADVFQFSAE